ncbi:MAG: carbon-nitrogen hydrolase family protein [Saprospiraceae bacterium]
MKIAIVQERPVFYNLKKCLAKAIKRIEEAAEKGADLIVFGETWLSGYPAFLDYCPNIGVWDYEPMKRIFGQIYQNSVDVGSETTQILAELARKHKVVIVIGVNEIAKQPQGTIYNTILTFNEKGELANHHRKLMPTFTEKLIHGTGDGNGLKSVNTNFGKLGSLICWEHWMPLTRQAMHNEGELVHIALWPNVMEMHQLASRHYAFEGRCFVVAVGQMMKVEDIPKGLKIPKKLKKQKWLLRGGSSVIAPNGEYILEPQYDKKGIFMVEINNLKIAYEERMALDVTGHYNRTDVFDFQVNKKRSF